MELTQLLILPFRIFLIFFVIFTIPVSYCCQLIKKICKWFVHKIAGYIINIFCSSSLSKIISNVTCFSQCNKQVQEDEETHSSQYLSPRTKEQYIQNICFQASNSPKKQTKNHKIMLLIQKLTTLEQALFSQSRIRCSIQKQIFNINIQTIQKDCQLMNLKKQNIKIMKQMTQLQNQLLQVEQQLIEEDQIVQLLESQVQQLKSYLQKLQKDS